MTIEQIRAAIKQGTFSFNQQKREQKSEKFEEKMKKRTSDNYAELYELRAKTAGWYTCYSCQQTVDDGVLYRTNSMGQKEIFLQKNELWKIGKHNLNDKDRYSKNSYESLNFDYIQKKYY